MPVFQVVPRVLQGAVRWLKRSTLPLWLLVPGMLIVALPCPTVLASGEPDPPTPTVLLRPADGEKVSAPSPDEPRRLPPVTVVAAPEEPPLSGKSVLTRETMDVLPEGNGSINEQLRVVPGVQFGEDSRSSRQGGEILPPDLSIAGGKPYQNNFTIDGLDNNSYSDPANRDPSGQYFMGGHPQALFLDADLVDEVRVYDHNVSARFGAFTGGVVDARTRDPGPEFGGSLHYRTTSDHWTELHVDSENEEEFENSHSSSRQPEFEKHDAGAMVNLPLGEGRGALVSYQRLQSSIPLLWLGDEKSDRRLLENYFAKYLHTLASGDVLRMTLIHAPYDEHRHYPDSVDGDYTVEGEGSSLGLSWEHPFALGILELRGGYRESDNRRHGTPYLFVWKKTPSRDWGLEDKSFEGGPGPMETNQKAWQAAFDLTFDEVATGPLRHRIMLGADRERVEAALERPEEFIFGLSAVEDGQVECLPGDNECIEGEQYIRMRKVHPAGRVKAAVDFYSAFVEDHMRLGRLEVRPGLRFSYDDFMDNHNLAPRLAASFDLLGDGGTLLIAGRNRYYGKTLLSYKLREMDRSYFQFRSSYAPWPSAAPADPDYRFSEQSAPRSDETVAGLDQVLLGGVARLRYIERDVEKEYAREKDPVSGAFVLNNKGYSHHRQYRFAWERWWRRHYLAVNIAYQQTRMSNQSYSGETFDLDDLSEDVWYDGDIVDLGELPRKDFNRPWVGNLVYSVRLPKGFTFTNVTRYRGGYRALKDTKKNKVLADGTEIDIYDEVENSESWLFDWKVSWRGDLGRDRAVQFDLEIDNVFDRKIESGEDDSGDYELGRQFWAGVAFDF